LKNVWPLGNITVCGNHYLWQLEAWHSPCVRPPSIRPCAGNCHTVLHLRTQGEMYSAINGNGNDEWAYLID